MGTVYLAADEQLERKVALKILSPELSNDSLFRARFERESRMAAALDHPHVVPVYSAGEDAGLYYIAMRYVEGTNLLALLAEQSVLPDQLTLAVLFHVASALDVAHARGLVHRDVKPANVLLAGSSPPYHAYLADFGLTRPVTTASLAGLTRDGQFVGTVQYASPEQVEGKPIDSRADVYALGCVLYRCLTGAVPFPRDNEMAVLWAHMYEAPQPVTALRPDLPPALDGIVECALAKSPDERYSSCGELIEAVSRALTATPGASGVYAAAGAVTSLLGGPRRGIVTLLVISLVPEVASDSQPWAGDPELLLSVRSRYGSALRTLVERHSGVVQPSLGEVITVVFGVPRVREDDAFRAVHAATEIHQLVREMNVTLEGERGLRMIARTGVSTGLVVAEGSQEGNVRVSGEPVSIAAGLEQAAAGDQILISQQTLRLTRHAVETADGQSVTVRGVAQPVDATRVLTVQPLRAGAGRRLDAPMIGRERELRLLWEAYERADAERTCHLFTLLGSAGVGKSRLVRELIQGVDDRATILRGRCLSYGEGITFWPVAEVVKQAAGIAETDSPDAARAALSAMFEGEDDAETLTDRLAQLVGIDDDGAPVDELSWATRKLFEALSRERPLVVVFDDIHWAETTFLDLIEYLVDWTFDAPILLVCLARPELLEDRPAWAGGKPNATSVLLEPLSSAESDELVQGILGEGGLDPTLTRRITAAADGNPLFVEEMVGMLIDDGLLRMKDGRWVRSGDLSAVAIPPSIHALLAARLDRLKPEERTSIEFASVMGKTFYCDALRQAVPAGIRPRLNDILRMLTKKNFIRPERPELPNQETFRFRHMLIREVAYDRQPKQLRAGVHEHFASWLEDAVGERIAEYEEVVAHHQEQAYRYTVEVGAPDERVRAMGRAAWERLFRAGRRAFSRGDMPAAANMFGRSATLPAPGAAEQVDVLLELAEAQADLGEFDQAQGTLSLAAGAAQESGSQTSVWNVRLVGLYVRYSVDPEREAEIIRECEEAVRLLARWQDHAGLVRAWRLLGWVHGTACRYGLAEQAVVNALKHARLAGDRRAETRNLLSFAISALNGPMPVPQAIAKCEQILRQVSDDRRAEGAVLCALSHLQGMAGNFEEARSLYRRARALLEDLGGKVMAATVSLDSGPVELLAGNPAAAERELRRDYEVLEAMGERYTLSTNAALLAEAVFLQGRIDEADELTAVSEEAAADDDVESQNLWRRMRARLLSARQDLDQACDLVSEALRLIEGTDAPVLRASTLSDYAALMAACGRDSESSEYSRGSRSLLKAKKVATLPGVTG